MRGSGPPMKSDPSSAIMSNTERNTQSEYDLGARETLVPFENSQLLQIQNTPTSYNLESKK